MGYSEVQFEFIENENNGLSKEQIEYIKNTIKYYMDKYPKVVLNTVCDFFSWDYMKRELNEYTYTHNRENKEYIKYNSLAKYNDNDKLIGFNHVKLCKMELDNKEIVEWVKQNKSRFDALKKKYNQLQQKNKITGISIPSFNECLSLNTDSTLLTKLEFKTKVLTEGYIDVMFIRAMEQYRTIKRLVIHEFGHAIAYSYNLEEDEFLKSLYDEL